MGILLLKLALAPAFVVAVSIIARRYGPAVGGVAGGLPVVAGPILLVVALQDGTAFAADAAQLSLASLTGLTAFVVVAANAPARRSALAVVIAGWTAFVAVAALLAWIEPSIAVAGLLSVSAFVLALRFGLPQLDADDGDAQPTRPRHDLLLRGTAAALMVLALTSLTQQLGATWTGVLAPFPIVTSVLAGFSLAHDPRPATVTLMRGMLRGFFAFATFLTLVALTLQPWGVALAFTVATASALALQALLLALPRC